MGMNRSPCAYRRASDGVLCEWAKVGDMAAVEALLARHRERLRYYANKYSMPDNSDMPSVVNKVFLATIANFDGARSGSIQTLFARMMLREVSHAWKASRTQIRGNGVTDTSFADMSQTPDTMNVESIVISKIAVDSITSLLDERTAVIVFMYANGHSQADIAAVLGLSQMHICRLFKAAIKQLAGYKLVN